MKVLDIGCGKSKIQGAIGVDFNANLGVDVVHDLNKFPYPFDEREFDQIHIRDTLFLLDNPLKVMEEVYRICKPGGGVVVVQPYFRSVWNFVDPWVKNFATVHSFAFYDPDELFCSRYEYSTARFKTTQIVFNEGLRNRCWLTSIVVALADKYPRQYEIYLSHLYPLDRITYYLKRV
jgi:SAM-dependent methyltransferase